MSNFKIVKVDSEYCDYLRQFDNRVPYNAGKKELRPFIGVLFMVNNMEYFAPLSSPKEKHLVLKNTIDLVKINNGKLGVININNMIPITNKNYEIFDLYKKTDDIDELKRLRLLKTQWRWLYNNFNVIKVKSYKLHRLYKENRLPINIKNRCCNFILLEEKCNLYNKITI